MSKLFNYPEFSPVKRLIFYSLFLLGISIRIVVSLSNTVVSSQYAADENTYAYFLKDFNSGFPNISSLNYIYDYSSFFFLPFILTRTGIEAVVALRISSIFFAILSMLIFTRLLLALCRSRNLEKPIPEIYFFWLPCIIFFFLPSHLFWSTVGLKESLLECAFLGLALAIYSVTNSVISKSLLVKTTLIVSFAVTTIHFVRFQITLIAMIASLSTAILCYFTCGNKVENRKRALSLLLANLFVPVIITANPVFHLMESQRPDQVKSSISPENSSSGLKHEIENSDSYSQPEIVTNKILTYRTFDDIRTDQMDNQLLSNKPIPELACPTGQNRFDLLSCAAIHYTSTFPKAFFSPFQQKLNADYLFDLIFLENVVWLFLMLILFIVSMYFIRSPLLKKNPFFLFIFILSILLVIGLLITAGNEGTVFRHKSILLWLLLLLPHQSIQLLKA
jgi:hypothetical protein